MTWQSLKAHFNDPIIVGGLILLVLGEVQAQSDVLLDWLGPTAAGRVLSLIGIAGMVIRYLQSLPASQEKLEHAARDHTGDDDVE